eukprot:jgi/Ulvmu1/4917/UM202_0002.1
MDVEDIAGGRDYNVDTPDQNQLVWATEVRCTGKEGRLADCFFPEQFGNGPVALPGMPRAPGQSPPNPFPGRACLENDDFLLGVVCRRFEIKGSDVIRRL